MSSGKLGEFVVRVFAGELVARAASHASLGEN
jgi:hypothetical protein